MVHRSYQFVGPSAIQEASRLQPSGTRIVTRGDLERWVSSVPKERTKSRMLIATFIIGLDGNLYIAPQRSEHVACASGGPVLSAGEITFEDDCVVVEITNQSTGFCPEPESWPAVSDALDRIGLDHPKRFTTEIVFRLCPSCGQRNVVKDSWFHCAVCSASLPAHWNFPSSNDMGEQIKN